ncbi:MAG: glycosyltransferase family 2 protein [Knoellia sp.]
MSADSGLVSVVIPVYDVEVYLEQCLDSVLAQTHRNLDVVVVDDGSTDGSGEICDAYAVRDSRVRVFHQTNQGLSAARNAGLATACGEFVTFLDSDDWWDPTFVARLVAALYAHPNAGTAMSTFTRVPGAEWVSPLKDTQLLTSQEAITSFAGAQHTLFTIACAKVFRRDVLGVAPFPVGRLHEDEFTTHGFLLSAPVVVVPHPLYLYRQRETGIVGSAMTPERLSDAVDAAELQTTVFLAAGFRGAAGWAHDQAFRRRVRLITLLTSQGRRRESAAQSVALSKAARTHAGLPGSAPLRLLRRTAQWSPGLAILGFGALTGVRSLSRGVVPRRGRDRT